MISTLTFSLKISELFLVLADSHIKNSNWRDRMCEWCSWHEIITTAVVTVIVNRWIIHCFRFILIQNHMTDFFKKRDFQLVFHETRILKLLCEIFHLITKLLSVRTQRILKLVIKFDQFSQIDHLSYVIRLQNLAKH